MPSNIASKMSLVKPFLEWTTTGHQLGFVTRTKILEVARRSPSPRLHGDARFSSTTSRRAGPPDFERLAIPNVATPAPKTLAGTVLTADPARVVG